MPQVVVPSPCFLRKGHLKRISQQAPQRLQSPRRRLSASITSSFLKRMRTKRRSLPCAWRARNLASATASARFAASRPSKVRRCRAARLAAVVGLITRGGLGRTRERRVRRPPGGRGARAALRASGAGRAALDVLVDHARDGLLRGRADDAFFFLAVLEEDERRDALDAVALRDR